MAADFTKKLLQWHQLNKRDMPWVGSRDPYTVWLSEIILQQTRVDQGTAYFKRFLHAYPTVQKLAKASIEEVMKLWEGLGYYSRAANMHATANFISTARKGVFPDTYEELIQLKGIGRYTAHAILSYAFGKPFAVTDANVLRVLSRVFCVVEPIDTPPGRRKIESLAESLLDKKKSGAFNQAMMDLGALVCKPVGPLCDACPVQINCCAFRNKMIAQYPVKVKKVIRKLRSFHFLLITDGKRILIEQRNVRDIWNHLFQFPLIETKKIASVKSLIQHSEFRKIFPEIPLAIEQSEIYKQQLTHRSITARFFHIRLTSLKEVNIDGCRIVPLKELITYSFPGIIREFLKRNTYF